MGPEILIILAAGYWLTESRTMDDSWRLDWETAAGVLRDVFDLAWQLILLLSLRWLLEKMSSFLPAIQFVVLGIMMMAAYGLSLLRSRPQGASASYFLALSAITFFLMQDVTDRHGSSLLEMPLRILGGSLVCEGILLGLKERLRWSPNLRGQKESPVVLLCLSIVALLFWGLRP